MTDDSQIIEKLDTLAGDYEIESIENVLKHVENLNLEELAPNLKVAVLRRKAEWLYALSNHEEDKKKRYELLENAYNSALSAHSIDESDFDAIKVLCSTSGRLAEESGIQKKIHFGFLFKGYLDKAIALNDNDFETLHMRGRFSYTVSSLSMVERIAAKVIGKIPETSYQEALQDLLKADKITPDVAENQLFVGKTYLALGDLPNAKIWLKMAAENESEGCVEEELVEEAKEILKDKKFAKI
ncbi:unnamed protein product [Caenorhabditis angaria]|uniref:Uncharacterized protein n=1 Tax=Caenorhabditis angaria TaxID=860376 RepID=A0A9P1I549_9PELO|nr:unnamed protein product [Caenorhabditis angaria]